MFRSLFPTPGARHCAPDLDGKHAKASPARTNGSRPAAQAAHLQRPASAAASPAIKSTALAGRSAKLVDDTAAPIDRVLQLVRLANQRLRDAASVAQAVDELASLQRRRHDVLQPDHVLCATAGLGLGALPPASREAVECLGGHIVRLAAEADYPSQGCAEALLELARAVPSKLGLAQRITVMLAFKRSFDALGEASQGKFPDAEVGAYKDKVSKLPQLALGD